MRILHTSDWHLGVSTGPSSRLQEQQWFVDWLLDLLSKRLIDVLVIAGDIFDTMHPSAEAQALYFRFLAGVGATGVRDVVVVGGNHDSPSRLDAPRALLRAVNVHVTGGVPTGDERAERMIVPVRRRGEDDVAAVCVAVPYVHEYRLGIRTSDLDQEQTREAFREAFAELYTSLVDEAERRYPGLPVFGTGHLTMGADVTPRDYPQAIHQVGTIDSLPTELLDPRLQYVALGHIHRCYKIHGTRAWYSGTPVAYSLAEMEVDREVLVVELRDHAMAKVEPVPVPRWRALLQVVGSPESVLAQLAGLSWSTPLPPLVHVRVLTQMAEPGLVRRLHEAMPSRDGSRPVLVEVRQQAERVDVATPKLDLPALDQLGPEQVFGLMCDGAQLGGKDRLELEQAFRQVASASHDVLQQMLADIELPASAGGGAQ
ncbi:MAG: exonuclease SbcD [Kiritimatiellia bacterium]